MMYACTCADHVHRTGTGKRMLRLDVGDDDKSRSHVVFVEFHGQQLDDALALIELKQEA